MDNCEKQGRSYTKKEIFMNYKSFRNDLTALANKLRLKSEARKTSGRRKDQDLPIASWIKEARLPECVGYEFVIIIKTKACRWAASESGGCTMCGYYNDKGADDITQQSIINQIEFALKKHHDEILKIAKNKQKIALKIFTSGSFLDDIEITSNTRKKIIERISQLSTLDLIVVESRPEFINENKLLELKSIINKNNKEDNKNIKFEIGIGLESANHFIREILINKGFSNKLVEKAVKITHSVGMRVKIYLLLKPPFISEKLAIKDAVDSIKYALSIKADSISINPVNIQQFTVTNVLFNKKSFRPPWIYSVIEVLNRALTKDDLKNSLILCEPSAAGKDKGIHNCNSKECNQRWLDILNNFILSQDLSIIDKSILPYNSCNCWNEYNLYLNLE